jgi:hypothetical protein
MTHYLAIINNSDGFPCLENWSCVDANVTSSRRWKSEFSAGLGATVTKEGRGRTALFSAVPVLRPRRSRRDEDRGNPHSASGCLNQTKQHVCHLFARPSVSWLWLRLFSRVTCGGRIDQTPFSVHSDQDPKWVGRISQIHCIGCILMHSYRKVTV